MEKLQQKNSISCKCIRCKGFVILDHVNYLSSVWLKELRCINCGWTKVEEIQ